MYCGGMYEYVFSSTYAALLPRMMSRPHQRHLRKHHNGRHHSAFSSESWQYEWRPAHSWLTTNDAPCSVVPNGSPGQRSGSASLLRVHFLLGVPSLSCIQGSSDTYTQVQIHVCRREAINLYWGVGFGSWSDTFHLITEFILSMGKPETLHHQGPPALGGGEIRRAT